MLIGGPWVGQAGCKHRPSRQPVAPRAGADTQGVERDHLVGDLAPVDGLGLAASGTWRAPPWPDGPPGAIPSALRSQCLSGTIGARVGAEACAIEHEKCLQQVVVPIRWVVRPHERGVNRLTGTSRVDDLMFQQKLASPANRGVADRFPTCCHELVQTPQRGQSLVERGVRRLGTLVAVPAAVGPLPVQKVLDQNFDPGVAGEPEPRGNGDGVTLLRSASTHPTRDSAYLRKSLSICPVGQDPVADHDRVGLPGGNPELDQRYQTPVRTGPFRVGMRSQWSSQKCSNHRTVQRSVGWYRMPEEVSVSHSPDGKVGLVEQQGNRRISGRHAPVSPSTTQQQTSQDGGPATTLTCLVNVHPRSHDTNVRDGDRVVGVDLEIATRSGPRWTRLQTIGP